jgi:hypothetical protein
MRTRTSATAGFDFTIFTKNGGPLTKSIALAANGKPASDSSLCAMAAGTARRSNVPTVQSFAHTINNLQSSEALCVGVLRSDLPALVSIVTVNVQSTHPNSGTVTRTRDNFEFPKAAGLNFLDHDTKSLSVAVKDKMASMGGFIPALLAVAPELAGVDVVVRKSTSSCLLRKDTGETFPDGDGLHLYIPVQDLSDFHRVLEVIHSRLWIAGLGCFALSKAGSLLNRSLIDTAVAASERPIFEAAPVVTLPLVQDRVAREAKVVTLPGIAVPGVIGPDGAVDTRRAIQPLTGDELRQKRELIAAARSAIAPAAERAREAFVSAKEQEALARGVTPTAAKRAARSLTARILLPDVELVFDDKNLGAQGRVLVRGILKDQATYVGKSLADPEEGVSYGRAKAHINVYSSGEAWVYSHAHGGQRFWLRHDAGTIEDAVSAAALGDKPEAYARAVAQSDIEDVAEETLRRRLIIEPGHARARPMSELVMKFRKIFSQARHRSVDTDAAGDGRKRLVQWADNTPVTDIMQDIDGILAGVPGRNPPMRDLDGELVRVGMETPRNLHRLSEAAGDGDRVELQPPPPQLSIIGLNPTGRYLLFEQHIDLGSKDASGRWRSTRINREHLTLYAGHRESALPKIGAVITTPIIQPDGTIRVHSGPDGDTGFWAIDPALIAKVPRTETVTRPEIIDACLYLANEWLGDTTATFKGRCSLVTAALTGVQRTTLATRPGFMLTAAQRGSGKTTAAGMVGGLVSGLEPAAGVWSEDRNERKKAFLSYLMPGPATLLLDNIPRGAEIDCPVLAELLTTVTYQDRVLGESRICTVSAQVLILLTGNNLKASEDNASRLLEVFFAADRPDPENRPFRRENPIEWTIGQRPELLRALFTVGVAHHVAPEIINPHTAVKGRFRDWWKLVARPVETAAALVAAAEAAQRKYYHALVAEAEAEPRLHYATLEASELEAEETAGSFLSSAATRLWEEQSAAEDALDKAGDDVLEAWVMHEQYSPAQGLPGELPNRRYPQEPEAIAYGQILRENEKADPKNEAAIIVFEAIRQRFGVTVDFTAKDICNQVLSRGGALLGALLAPTATGGQQLISPEEFEDALRRVSNTEQLRTRALDTGYLVPSPAAVGRALGRIKGQRFGSENRQFWLELTREGDGNKPSLWQVREQ